MIWKFLTKARPPPEHLKSAKPGKMDNEWCARNVACSQGSDPLELVSTCTNIVPHMFETWSHFLLPSATSLVWSMDANLRLHLGPRWAHAECGAPHPTAVCNPRRKPTTTKNTWITQVDTFKFCRFFVKHLHFILHILRRVWCFDPQTQSPAILLWPDPRALGEGSCETTYFAAIYIQSEPHEWPIGRRNCGAQRKWKSWKGISSFPRFPNAPFLFLLGDRSRAPVPEKTRLHSPKSTRRGI